MNFDDHEIWGAPVRASESTPEAPAADVTAGPAADASAGRLYRSAGSEPHPEAILALPNHRRHTAVHPLAGSQWATPSPSAPAAAAPAPAAAQAPITINSRIPRPGSAEDPAIAEVLDTPRAASAAPGFTGWFKSSGVVEGAVPAEPAAAPALAASGERLLSGAMGAVAAIPLRAMTGGTYVLVLAAVTALVGVVETVVSDGAGIATGIALVLATVLGSWQITAESRWAAWSMPAYALIVAIVVAGQFGAGAPGASLVGQAMLVVTGLITMAPWLAAATVTGILVPAIRAKRN